MASVSHLLFLRPGTRQRVKSSRQIAVSTPGRMLLVFPFWARSYGCSPLTPKNPTRRWYVRSIRVQVQTWCKCIRLIILYTFMMICTRSSSTSMKDFRNQVSVPRKHIRSVPHCRRYGSRAEGRHADVCRIPAAAAASSVCGRSPRTRVGIAEGAVQPAGDEHITLLVGHTNILMFGLYAIS